MLEKETGGMALGYSHVSVDQAVDAVDVPVVAPQQDDDQDDDDQSGQAPAQQEVEQVAPLRVLVVHHQHLPEVHRLGARGGWG